MADVTYVGESENNPRPYCPGCGWFHYPAELGDGSSMWCNNIPTDVFPLINQAKVKELERIVWASGDIGKVHVLRLLHELNVQKELKQAKESF